MNIEPKKAYVYQPMPPQEDGRFYGVGGLQLFGLDFDDADLKGVTKSDAEKIAAYCNENPEEAPAFIEWVKERMIYEWYSNCGCRFDSLFSNAVKVCEQCSKLPCFSGYAQSTYPFSFAACVP